MNTSLIILIALTTLLLLIFMLTRTYRTSEHFHPEPLTIDQYRYKAYQQISVQSLQDLCEKQNTPFCFSHPSNMTQFQKSIKMITKDAIMHAIKTKDYYYLILILLKINSLEMSFLGYEDCVYFHNNACGTAIVTSILNKKSDMKKLTLLRVSDMLSVFNNDAFRLENDQEIDEKIKELGLNSEDGDNYRVFYKNIVQPLLNDQEFKDQMNFNKTEDMPLILFAKYGTAVRLSNYLFNTNTEECESAQ
jgi:hypothetical protein